MKTRSMTWENAIPDVAAADSAESAALPMDHETFAAFYERTARPLWAYLTRVSGNSALADDLLQESYLRFLGAKIPDGEVACRHYLFRIATNLLRDHWRKPRPARVDEIPEENLVAVSPSPSDHIDAQAAVASVFPRMRPRERQLLWLAYAEGSSHREIAQITGLAETSIRLLLFRAKHKLARLLRQRGLQPWGNS